jgi:hypothetical protein
MNKLQKEMIIATLKKCEFHLTEAEKKQLKKLESS